MVHISRKAVEKGHDPSIAGDHDPISHHSSQNTLVTDIEARPTAAVTGGSGVIHDLELTADQFHRVVHLTAGQQLQRGLVHNDLGVTGPLGGPFFGRVLGLEDGVFFGVDL